MIYLVCETFHFDRWKFE